jgi:RimJ/RimL family protein N-acetyltransferase
MRFPIEGRRVLLRPFADRDAEQAHRIFGDAEVMRWVGDGPLADVAATEAVLRQYATHQARHGFSFWAVVERASGALIGDAGLYMVEDGEVQLGYTLGRRWWGRGYATEAGRLCVAAAFGELGLPELCAVVEPENRQSIRVLEKLGFTADGRRLAYGREHLVYRLRRPGARRRA